MPICLYITLRGKSIETDTDMRFLESLFANVFGKILAKLRKSEENMERAKFDVKSDGQLGRESIGEGGPHTLSRVAAKEREENMDRAETEKELQALTKKLGGGLRIERGLIPVMVFTIAEARTLEAMLIASDLRKPTDDSDLVNLVMDLLYALSKEGNLNHLDAYGGALFALDLQKAFADLRKDGWEFDRPKEGDAQNG